MVVRGLVSVATLYKKLDMPQYKAPCFGLEVCKLRYILGIKTLWLVL